MVKAIEVQAPNERKDDGRLKIFLAGTIDQGNSVDWQRQLIEDLKDEPIQFLNPRRDDWDPTWDQSSSNKDFKEQVNWELDSLRDSALIVMYFAPNSKSPISLLEMGLFKDREMVVVCPEGFYRKGNVDIVCEKYKIKQMDSLDDLAIKIKEDISFSIHGVVYDEVDKIVGKAVFHFGELVGRSKKPNDDMLNELRTYAEQYLDESNELRMKTLYTMLIILKPYKKSEILGPIFEQLVELRDKRKK